MNPMYLTLGLTAIMIIIFAFVLSFVKKKEKQYHDLAQTGPFADAVIEQVEKKFRTGRNYMHSRPYYDCLIRYEDNYGVSHQTILPYMPYSYVPVGGAVRIAYNPKDFDNIALVEATFMNTPEYIYTMEEKGYKKTEYGFELVRESRNRA